MKTVFFVTVLSFSAILLNAQARHNDMEPHVELGLKGGLNIANLHNENSTNPDSKAAVYLGGLAHIHLTKYLAVQPEIMFSGQGASQTIMGTDYKLTLNYVTLPVLAQFMVGNGFRLESGPQLGILAAAHSKVEGTSTDVKDNYKGVDFGWVFGLGYLTHSGFGLDARYNLGVSNINDVNSTNINNRVFAVGIFYQFRNM
jgi:hypothetical protein